MGDGLRGSAAGTKTQEGSAGNPSPRAPARGGYPAPVLAGAEERGGWGAGRRGARTAHAGKAELLCLVKD